MQQGNPFYVSPLGGLDLGKTVGGIYNAYNQRQAIDEQKGVQQAQQKEIQELAMAMQNGDMQAGQTLYAKYPDLAAKVDAGMKIQDERQLEQVRGFYERLAAIPTIQGKRDYLKQTAGKTPFTADDELLAMSDEELERSFNVTAPRYLSKEQLAAVGGTGLTTKEQADIDIKKEANELRRLEIEQRNLDRQISRETNELKRQELESKLEANKVAQEQKKRDTVAQQESTIARFDNALNTINKIESSPGFSAAVGARLPFVDQLPGSEAQETIGLIDTLKSQSFLNEIGQMKGMGALSNAEGAKLESAISSLNRDMKEDAFKRSLQSIRDYFTVAKERARKQMGVEPEAQQTQTNTVNWADL